MFALLLLACVLQIWRANDLGGWDEEQTLHAHKDWVRDAAWAPNLGMPLNTIASGGQDGQVGVALALHVQYANMHNRCCLLSHNVLDGRIVVVLCAAVLMTHIGYSLARQLDNVQDTDVAVALSCFNQ